MNDPTPVSDIVTTGEAPWPVGTFRGPDTDDVRTEFDKGRWTLTGLNGDHVIFSSSLLALSGVAFDPVSLYWEESNLSFCDTPYECIHNRVILSGLTPPFDATVYACPKSHADGLITFLDRFSVRSGSVIYDSVKQIIPIVDWRLLDKTSVAPLQPPTVPIVLYGLESSATSYLWRPPLDPWKEPIRLIRTERKRSETVSWAKKTKR
jgi:hypothetical protein